MLTPKDLKEIEMLFERMFDRKFEEKFEEIRLYFSNEVLQFKDDILTELVKVRTDVDILVGNVGNHKDRITSLDGRVSTLEHPNAA